MKMNTLFVGTLLTLFLNACGGGGSNSPGPEGPLACTNSADDSQLVDGIATRIKSDAVGDPVYHLIPSVRKDEFNFDIWMDYMVHPSTGVAKAVVVLIAGGTMNASLGGIDGAEATSSGGNFLVRSAHLFASQGYKVITIDQPLDIQSILSSSEVDLYRTSVRHAVDLTTIINMENSTGLPVIFAGTSRGAISAVAQSQLADAIALSSPVTSGGITPVDESGSVKPSAVTVPAQVMWHVDDGCSVTKVSDSENLVTAFTPAAASKGISGGFDHPAESNPCKAKTAHGFFGIESCAVGVATDWMDGLSLPDSKPKAGPAPGKLPAVASGASINLPIKEITAAKGGELSFSLPFASTSLGGTVTISGNTVTYTAPIGVTSTTDYFVYVVLEAGGGKLSRTVAVIIK